ncbi:phosphopantetheine-binding protein [Streptomyces sp. NPDC004250]|uniref:acyl carrier protein n=1 Tax=Streptomyces sp. NPDC004250 TaxID=3364692 RepID=UPI003684BEAB
MARVIRDLLGLAELGSEETLYDLGADSLILISLIARIEDDYGVEFHLASFSHRVSLMEIDRARAGVRGARADAGAAVLRTEAEERARTILTRVGLAERAEHRYPTVCFLHQASCWRRTRPNRSSASCARNAPEPPCCASAWPGTHRPRASASSWNCSPWPAEARCGTPRCRKWACVN